MKNRELIVPIFIKGGKACSGFQGEPVKTEDVTALALDCENNGADALILFDLSSGDEDHERSISLIRQIGRATDLPLYGGGNIRRLEDVKKLIYAGCKKVFFNCAREDNRRLMPEAKARFGKERMIACVSSREELQMALAGDLPAEILLLDQTLLDAAVSLIDQISSPEESPDILISADGFDPKNAAALLADPLASGLICSAFADPDFSFMEAKSALKEQGIQVNTWEPAISWEDIKTNSDGLLPVVVQDYRTLEVLMVAYMNEESFRETVRTGRMTYFSRSRQTLWVKGETSGHFQYVRELVIDCDSDTLLAKVLQIGAACHTGNRSCFYRPIMHKDYNTTNPMKVFEDVYAVIEDRKAHPKEGSYTNYLFDKGIDKILKKIGEESSEIIIAAKNPDPDEVIYEISDFLYHLMVLMSERGLTWEDITEELAKR